MPCVANWTLFPYNVRIDAANHHTRSTVGYERAEAANDRRVLIARHQLIELLQNLLLGGRQSPYHVLGYVLVGRE